MWATWMPVAEFTRLGLATVRDGAVRPYVGAARLSFHADEFLVLSWTFSLLALGLHYFTRLRPVWAALPFAVSFALCLEYPWMRGESLALLYRVVSLGGCLVVWGAIAWAMMFRDDARPNVTHLVVMFVAASEVINVAVPFAADFFRDWDMVRIANVVTAVACIGAHVWQLTRSPVEEAAR